MSSISCMLLVNLPRNEMARSTAASAGQYVRTNAKTRQTFTHWTCSRSGVKASHIRNMGVLAKVRATCSLKDSHSSNARAALTCAAAMVHGVCP